MGEPKPLASLSSGLLARKGQAKPAMRPQGFGGFGASFGHPEDLGWNDMGHDTQMPVSFRNGEQIDPGHLASVAVPQVVRQREELADEFRVAPEDAFANNSFEPDYEELASSEGEGPVHPLLKSKRVEAKVKPAAAKMVEARPLPTVAIARAKKAAKGRKGKAAFTLRVDPERHLKLRLACAISRESAQSIVTEALDRYLASIPEIEDLTRKLPGGSSK